MKRRSTYHCPDCRARLLSVGCSVHDEADAPVAEWWLCPRCREYHRVDLQTGALVSRATWARELAAGISELCGRSKWSESYEAREGAERT